VIVDVLGSDDDAAWLRALEPLDHDVYHHIEYARAVEANGDGRAIGFVVEDGDRHFFHVSLQRPIERVGGTQIDGRWSDLESVYGYSGPLASSDDRDFLANAWAAFDDWCTSEHVVAEFIRFSPLLRNESLASTETRVGKDRDTIAVRLDVGEAELWGSYPPVQRNMVRKAERHGLTAAPIPVEEGIGRFRAMYERTMERVGAEPYYLFSDSYYERLLELGPALVLFEATDPTGEAAAAALLLVDGDRLHYHLSASLEDFRDAAPMNLVLHAAASWGRERGLRLFHLGGGRSPAEDDSLLRFKESFSRIRLPFFTGRRVHDSRMYGDLCTMWLDQALPPARPPYFLLYRLPVRP